MDLEAGILGFIIGAVTTAGSYLTGYLMGIRRRRPPREPRPICACDHTWGEHDATGKCLANKKQYKNYDKWDWIPCPCRRYVGPEPLPQYISGELP